VKLSKEQRRFLEAATLQFLSHVDEAADWLEGRGIDLAYARSRGLGVVPEDAPQQLRKYHGRLAIPYLTDAGPVNITFRCLQSHDCKVVGFHGKYEKMKGWGTNLYGVQSLRAADDWIAVAEGEMDALTLGQLGIPAIGVPGAKNWQPHWSNVFEDFSKVYVFSDGDTAGEEMWETFSNELKTAAIQVAMPRGEDVNSVFLKQGPQALWDRIRQ